MMESVKLSLCLRFFLSAADLLTTEGLELVEPQFCLSDLQTVLRDITAKLAKQEERIRQLQDENTEQAAKLERNEGKIQQLEMLNQALDTELRSLITRTNATENHMETLWRDREEGRVAFSASLLPSGSKGTYTGPFNTHTTLVYRNVVFNMGNAYNPTTGIFTAPVRGVYHFEFYIFGGGSPRTVVSLAKNGQHVYMAQENQSSGWATAANGASLQMERGDTVFLRLWANTRIYDDGDHYSTFSGRLLFTL